MRVGRSIQKAITKAQAGDLESVMMRACSAVDGTAAKRLEILGAQELVKRLQVS